MFKRLLNKIFFIVIVFLPIFSAYGVNNSIQQSIIKNKLAKLELISGGRLGVYAINTANNSIIKYREEERFPFCSTSKVMAVSAILEKSMVESSLLDKNINYSMSSVISSGYAPITREHIATGMTIGELCRVAVTYSDNMAMNLLIRELGGSKNVTLYARSIGNKSFRLDRMEPELNSAIPNDIRDTVTPKDMAQSLQKLSLGNYLASQQQNLLNSWLKQNTTGGARIRAGVPKNWIVGDKTGSGAYGTTNDIGVIWPPNASPIVLAIYFTHNTKKFIKNDDIIANVTRILVDGFSNKNK